MRALAPGAHQYGMCERSQCHASSCMFVEPCARLKPAAAAAAAGQRGGGGSGHAHRAAGAHERKHAAQARRVGLERW